MNRLIPIIAIIFAVGLFFGYISPTYNGQIVSAKQQIQSYDAALAAATAFTQKEADLTAKENAIPASQITRLSEYMPDGVDNVQLILDLNSLASRSGITLSDFKVNNNSANQTSTTGAAAPATPVSGTPAATTGTTPQTASTLQNGNLQSSSLTDSLDLSVSANGTYGAFESFLTAAEQSLRPLDVTSLSIKSSTTGVNSYLITFRIYWLH